MPETAQDKFQNQQISLAIFASGTGTNAEKIIDYSYASGVMKVDLVVCNNPFANVMNIAAARHIPSLLIEKDIFFSGDGYVPQLEQRKISFIALAGFLWKIPASIIEAYPAKIVNIHPALLPKHGGKNMYGDKVHQAVLASGDRESGITIHYVDGEYDNGDIIFQKKCAIEDNETVETLANKIHALEHEHYPRIIEKVSKSQLESGE